MLSEEQKQRRRLRRQERYRNDPGYREKARQYVADWHSKNPRDRREYLREYQRTKRQDPEQREKEKLIARARRLANPEKARETSNRAKAKARKERPELHTNQWLGWAYKMRPEEYEAKLAHQNGRCAICFGDNGGKKLVVDHDHDKPKGEGNRWLLCSPCNIMIGAAKEHPERLRRAAELLEGYRGCS